MLQSVCASSRVWPSAGALVLGVLLSALRTFAGRADRLKLAVSLVCGPWHGRRVAAEPSRVGLVIDEWGVYLSYCGKLVGRGTSQPIWPRERLGKGTAREIRARLALVRSDADRSAT